MKRKLQVEFPWYFILQKMGKDGINIYNTFQVPTSVINMGKILYAIHIELFAFLPALPVASPLLCYLVSACRLKFKVFKAQFCRIVVV